MNNAKWPPPNGLCTPTVSRDEAVLTIFASISISAPASLVFDILRDSSNYSEWNSWCPRITNVEPPSPSELATGTTFTLHAIMDASKPTKESPTHLRISDVSTPQKPSTYIAEDIRKSDSTFTEDLNTVYRISWKSTEGGFVARGLRTERFHEIIVRSEQECEVRTWEVMGGVLARTVKWLYQETLNKKFQLWCEDLKKASEGANIAH